MLTLLLVACWSDAPALPGTLAWVVEEQDGAPSLRWAAASDLETVHRAEDLPGATFPAAPDPLGTHLLVVSSEDTAGDHRETLWLLPKDGGEPLRLGEPAGRIRNPAWAPDGSWVAYESDQHAFREILRVNRDGSDVRRLTRNPRGDFEPSIAASDSALTFVSSRDGDAEIYVMAQDGTNALRVTNRAGTDSNPTWSPDGQSIAWLAWQGEQVQAMLIHRGEAAGRPLRSEGGTLLDTGVIWSPSGDRLAVTTTVNPGDTAIELYRPDGTLIGRIDGPGPDEHPTFSPDGSHLLFTSSREGQPDLYVAASDGSAIRPLVRSADPEWLPRWGP